MATVAKTSKATGSSDGKPTGKGHIFEKLYSLLFLAKLFKNSPLGTLILLMLYI